MWVNALGNWKMVMSRPGYFSQHAHTSSAAWRRMSCQLSPSGGGVTGAPAWARQAWTRRLGCQKPVDGRGGHTELVATPAMVKRSMPRRSAAITASSLVNLGLGPVLRPSRGVTMVSTLVASPAQPRGCPRMPGRFRLVRRVRSGFRCLRWCRLPGIGRWCRLS